MNYISIKEKITRFIHSAYIIETVSEKDHFKLVASAQKEQTELIAKQQAEYKKAAEEKKKKIYEENKKEGK